MIEEGCLMQTTPFPMRLNTDGSQLIRGVLAGDVSPIREASALTGDARRPNCQIDGWNRQAKLQEWHPIEQFTIGCSLDIWFSLPPSDKRSRLRETGRVSFPTVGLPNLPNLPFLRKHLKRRITSHIRVTVKKLWLDINFHVTVT